MRGQLAIRALTVGKKAWIDISCAAMNCTVVTSHANCGREARGPRSGSCFPPEKEALVFNHAGRGFQGPALPLLKAPSGK